MAKYISEDILSIRAQDLIHKHESAWKAYEYLNHHIEIQEERFREGLFSKTGFKIFSAINRKLLLEIFIHIKTENLCKIMNTEQVFEI